jgi:hypothetical protein
VALWAEPGLKDRGVVMLQGPGCDGEPRRAGDGRGSNKAGLGES